MTLKKVIPLALGFFALFAQQSYGSPLNGDFSSNLDHWTASGAVSVVSQEAQLTDNQGSDSQLYQGVALTAGQYTLDFDVFNQLSSDVPGGSFPDTFFASLYFINDLSQFDLANAIFDGGLGLFDLDYSGVANNQGAIGSSIKGVDWLHFSILFNNSYNFAIPTFELFNLNATDSDSQVFVDNVVISAVPANNTVPEPSTLFLWLVGLSAFYFSRNRRNAVYTEDRL